MVNISDLGQQDFFEINHQSAIAQLPLANTNAEYKMRSSLVTPAKWPFRKLDVYCQEDEGYSKWNLTLALRSPFCQQHKGDMGYLENKQSVIRDKTAKAFVIGPDVDPVEVGVDRVVLRSLPKRAAWRGKVPPTMIRVMGGEGLSQVVSDCEELLPKWRKLELRAIE